MMRKVLNRIYNLIWNINECPPCIRWRPLSPAAPMQQIHWYASHHQFASHALVIRISLKLLLLCLWPFRLLVLIHQYTHKFGPEIRLRTGKSLYRQIGEQLWLALHHTIAPVGYYQYQLYRSRNSGEIEQYVFQAEASSLFQALNGERFHEAIDNKHAFHQLCRQQNLPSIATLHLFDKGKEQFSRTPRPPFGPEISLFVKPAQGARGEGAMRWEYVADGCYQNPLGTQLPWPKLVAHLKVLSQTRAYLIQPHLFNHKEIADLSPHALLTIRLVTGRTPTAEVIPIAATLKMPRRQQAMTSTYGLNSAIQLETGILGKAYSYRPVCSGYNIHPVTKAEITGRRLPKWSQALDIAKQAHTLFPNFVFLGWDLAFTAMGYILVEANIGWDVLTVQKPQCMPLGATCFTDICMMWFQAQSKESIQCS